MLEHIPLIAFGITYYLKGLLPATAVLIAVSLFVIPILWKKTGKAPTVHIFTTLLLGIMGGATLFSGDTYFIKMKPTVASFAFASILLGGLLLKKNPLKIMLGSAFSMSNNAWKVLSIRQAVFFIIMGLLNEYVWRHYTDGQWVQFKLFGFSGGYLLFMVSQIPFLKKHATMVTK